MLSKLSDRMELSVVIASIDGEHSIDSCLRHLDAACAGIPSELILCDGSHDGPVERGQLSARPGGAVTFVRFPEGTLVPTLWAEGFRRSTGRIVAFTTSHCLVSPGWARALIDALDAGATGAGGPLVIASRTRPLDWAVFYLRYSAFMPETMGSGKVSGEIAGDNAAYVRAALDRHAATFDHGFWEIDFHRLIRAEGGWLAGVPSATAAFAHSFRFRTIAAHRFEHGRQFGATRVQSGARSVPQMLIAAPLVPFVLTARAGRRVFSTRQGGWRFIAALPWFMLLAGAWALGEAVGALRAEN